MPSFLYAKNLGRRIRVVFYFIILIFNSACLSLVTNREPMRFVARPDQQFLIFVHPFDKFSGFCSKHKFILFSVRSFGNPYRRNGDLAFAQNFDRPIDLRQTAVNQNQIRQWPLRMFQPPPQNFFQAIHIALAAYRPNSKFAILRFDRSVRAKYHHAPHHSGRAEIGYIVSLNP